jgi:predicted branched-subunit amino acid permease
VDDERSDLRAGFRKGLPFVFPTFALAASFGVLAEPVMGEVAPIVMSIFVFAGSAQFAALGVLGADGAAGAAIVAGLLMNARYLMMGFALAPSLRGSALKRAAEGQAVVDASWAIARRPDGTFDRNILIGATIPMATAWFTGTAAGVFGGSIIGDPEQYGLDAIFPAFFLFLLVAEGGSRTAFLVALVGGSITLALMSFVPVGLAVLAAATAALIGLRRS